VQINHVNEIMKCGGSRLIANFGTNTKQSNNTFLHFHWL